MTYVSFPPKEEVVATLAGKVTPGAAELFGRIAERLDSQTYESAAFTFILMEIIHDYEIESGQDLEPLLPRCIVALTGDAELASTALASFHEIKQSFKV